MRGVWCPWESNHRAANDPTYSQVTFSNPLGAFGILIGTLVLSKNLKNAQNAHFSTFRAK